MLRRDAICHRCGMTRASHHMGGQEHLFVTMKTGIELIAEERAEHRTREGYSDNHDDQHRAGEIAMAAVCYALPSWVREHPTVGQVKSFYARFWPWEPEDWKPSPKDRVRELVKAGALIASEIDRLQRVKAP